ncbi:hypothetical protein [Corynebacterium cystitidis]|uniref:mRNA interferase RelE/StbE n=1 Tax=Corynebacterium cystitidis DSM 20524 TaxID=1121357 RepID=A0A1H9V3G1_9CORY|nr:hypothetical protein [Corynebacterium cystitidis]WJY83379.1 hypothetical protein CCYS_12460 [Corynebacterium cystitidis DSM 20524]SES15904.1 mRNA interferase RelE/StbE [Corynebacterium cystitidis DSM 20524]SNV62455.1 addiction module antitoxin [Corynebacterium cystitidis]
MWRETTDESHQPVLEIAEIWAVGARADSEIYDEIVHRVRQLKESRHPHARALADVIKELGRFYGGVGAHPEPSLTHALPPWLVEALENQLHLSSEKIQTLNEDEAKQLLIEHWTKPPQ